MPSESPPHPDQRVAERVARLWVRRIQRDRAAQGAFRGVEPLRGKMNPADGADRRVVLAAEEQRHEKLRQGLVSAPDTEEGEPEILVSLGVVRQQPRALRQRGNDLFVQLLMTVRELGNSPEDRGLPGDNGQRDHLLERCGGVTATVLQARRRLASAAVRAMPDAGIASMV